jgi:folate-dependent phosphoribosylglycinamide formyltransferase PurN
MTLRLGWFTTARGPGSRGMFEAVWGAIARGELDAEFGVLFCNRERGEAEATDAFLDLVEAQGIPLVTRSSVRYRRAAGGERSRTGAPLPAWRLAYDRAVEEALAPHAFDLGVLAGYMLIFEREFVTRHPLLNLHPALPNGPAGTWQEVIRALIRGRAIESGVMTHLAIPEVDAGPAATFCRYALRGPRLDALWEELEPRVDRLDDEALERTPLFAAIRAEGVAREAPFLVASLAEFAARRLFVRGGRVTDASGAPVPPRDVTSEVEARLSAVRT